METIFDSSELITCCQFSARGRKLEELYHKYQKGEVSLGYLAKEIGVTVRKAMELLEERGLRTTNWLETPPDLDSISKMKKS